MDVVPPDLDNSYLSPEQQQFFAEFGFLHLPRLFSPAEAQRMSEEFDATIDSYVEPPVALETEAEYAARVGSEPAGLAHDGSARTMIGGPIEHRMPWILDHPGILGALRGVIGRDFNYCSGDGNYYTGDTHWHPDGSWGQLFGVKVAITLTRLHRPEHPL